MIYKFFNKKSSGTGITNEPNYQLANELHKPKLLEHLRKHKSIAFKKTQVCCIRY